jgi:uncharacterized membrane protein
MLVLAFAGTAVAAYLSWVALDPNKELACGVVGDCHAVQSSSYAEIDGVPIALFGLLMYLGLLALTAARLVTPAGGRLPEVLVSLTFALALGGMVYSAYLTYLELVVIDALCVWCIASAMIVTALFAMTLPDLAARIGDGQSANLSVNTRP